MIKTKKKQSKIVDGRYQLGIVTDWLYRQNVNITPEAKILYSYIAFTSLNVYHKRKVAISAEKLPFKGRRLYKYRDELVSLGYIGWQNTTAYSLFWLLEPNYTMRNFVYSGDEVKKESEIETIADENLEF